MKHTLTVICGTGKYKLVLKFEKYFIIKTKRVTKRKEDIMPK